MNKSFQESNGTVLSTNWGDIGAKETTVQPPTGMEEKKYDDA
jgi:suppressor of G2 allele of SKP1